MAIFVAYDNQRKHDKQITDYKKEYNQEFYDPIEVVLHKCGFCEEYLLFDNDAIDFHASQYSY